MSFFNNLINNISRATGMGNCSLKAAYLDEQAPKGCGVYKIKYQGQLMKVGKAEDGLRKRFSDYYRGQSGGTAGLKYITESNRDDVTVMWVECSRENTRSLEKQWYDEARAKGEELPWSDRR